MTTLRRTHQRPRVHYGYRTAGGELVAFCQTRTAALMYSPRLTAQSGQVSCRLCQHHLGRQGAPIP